MANSETRNESTARLQWLIEQTLHPFLLFSPLLLWLYLKHVGFEKDPTPLVLIVSLILLYICEKRFPAYRHWHQTRPEKLTILGIGVVFYVTMNLASFLYFDFISPFVVPWVHTLGMQVWPTDLPIGIQAILLYFYTGFVLYWIHRSQHRFTWLWRLSGHGFHHSFRNMHAINYLTTHPIEVFFLLLPMFFFSDLIGATPEAARGMGLLTTVNSVIAHSNICTKSTWMGWLFTTPEQHQRHHSAVLVESNTNFGCNAILWDRVFGTYSEGAIEQTGIGPTEPTLWEKICMPLRDPR